MASFSKLSDTIRISETDMRRFLTAILFALPVSAAQAEPVVYECHVQRRDYPIDFWNPFENIIQPKIRIVIDAEAVTVEDRLVQSVEGGPIQATLSENSDKKFAVKWHLVASGFGGRQATMFFRAAFFKQRNELIVTQAVAGTTTTFHARGKCR